DRPPREPQSRLLFAPTPPQPLARPDHPLRGEDAGIGSSGQGCEGEPLTRDDTLIDATREIRRRHPSATIHINTNGSRPRVLARRVGAGGRGVRIAGIASTGGVAPA